MQPDPTPVLPPDVSADDAEILWTSTGRPFVRTPDECFSNLPDYPWEPNYAEVDGMRMHYVDAGDPNGEVVLLLHGQQHTAPVDDPVDAHLGPATSKARKPLSFRAFRVVAGAGFEPATFGL